MKKLIMKMGVICLLLQNGTIAKTQNYREHSFAGYFGGGAGPKNKSVNKLNKYFTEKYTILGSCHENNNDEKCHRFHFTLNFDYQYRFHRLWAAGVVIGWNWASEMYSYDYQKVGTTVQQERLKIADGNNVLNNTKHGELTYRSFYIMPSLKIYYPFAKIEDGGFYSRVAAGICREHLTFNYQMQVIDYDPKSIPFGELAENPFPLRMEQNDDTSWRFAYQLSVVGLEYSTQHIILFCEIGYGNQGSIIIGARYVLSGER